MSNANAGRILSMPSYGRKEIDLTQFVREGLDVLDNWSVIRYNPTINRINKSWLHPLHVSADKSIVSPKNDPTCELCHNSLRKAAGIPDSHPANVPHAKYGMVLFNHKGREIFVCAKCAAKDDFREIMVNDIIPESWAGLVADDGGEDVFHLVSELFFHNSSDLPIHGITFRPDRSDCVNVGTGNQPKYVPQRTDWHHAKLMRQGDSLKAKLEREKDKAKKKK